MRTIGNPSRGCGSLKSGGTYARSDSSIGGQLANWAWTLGTGIEGEHNLYLDAPARQMGLIALSHSLLAGQVIETVKPLSETEPEALRRLPRISLIDHVGSQHYTPYEFVLEAKAYGVSRRIPQKIGAKIAKHTPIPIVFTHSDMPIVNQAVVSDLYQHAMSQVGSVFSEHQFRPTYENPKWGIWAGDFDGEDHWLVPVLHHLSKAKGHLTTKVSANVAEQMMFAEQALGISWITSVVYITTGQETPSELDELYETGIEPVKIEEV